MKAEKPQIFCAGKLTPADSLNPHPRNPNEHPERQIDLLAKIILQNGMRAPIVVSNRSGFIIKGHARLEAAIKAGLEMVPVDFQDYDSENSEMADLLADNRIAELAEADISQINAIIDELEEEGFDLDLTGFDLQALDEELFRGPPTFPEESEAPEDEKKEVSCRIGEWEFKLDSDYYSRWAQSVKKISNFDTPSCVREITKRLKIQRKGIL